MIVVLKRGTTQAQVDECLQRLESLGLEGRVIREVDKPLVHIIRGRVKKARALMSLERVQALVRTRGPRIQRYGRRFFPYHFLNWTMAALLLIGILVLLAGILPPGLGDRADVRQPTPNLAPPWYFRGLEQFLLLFPDGFGWLSFVLVGLIWALILFVPALDRTPSPALRDRKITVGLGILAMLGAIFLSLKGVVWP